MAHASIKKSVPAFPQHPTGAAEKPFRSTPVDRKKLRDDAMAGSESMTKVPGVLDGLKMSKGGLVLGPKLTHEMDPKLKQAIIDNEVKAITEPSVLDKMKKAAGPDGMVKIRKIGFPGTKAIGVDAKAMQEAAEVIADPATKRDWYKDSKRTTWPIDLRGADTDKKSASAPRSEESRPLFLLPQAKRMHAMLKLAIAIHHERKLTDRQFNMWSRLADAADRMWQSAPTEASKDRAKRTMDDWEGLMDSSLWPFSFPASWLQAKHPDVWKAKVQELGYARTRGMYEMAWCEHLLAQLRDMHPGKIEA